MRIHTVCTGNICRSPMAAALLSSGLDAARNEVSSSGVSGLSGQRADPLATRVCRDHGLDISTHIARTVDECDLVSQDLILAMEHEHRRFLAQRFPHLQGRIFLLGRWENELEIPDPYGRDETYFLSVFELIERCCRSWLTRL